MGGLLSTPLPYITDPNAFATQVDQEVATSGVVARDDALKRYKSYDYVVVGGGTAGCVLASRLSEDPGVRVLLVEAGTNPDKHANIKVPPAFPKLYGSDADWKYKTTPQAGLGGREMRWPRGKVLGGCSSINAMVYHHCAPSDFDEWESLGNVGWSYKDLYPYFKKSESYTPNPEFPGIESEHRGTDGPWQTRHTFTFPATKKFLVACQEAGIEHNPDMNTPQGTLGVNRAATFIDQKGQRSSAATSYLTPEVLSRSNLTVVLETLATKVLFSDDAQPRAVGVEFAKEESGPRFRVAASREVIVTAGSVNTPHLLNLSGIGDAEQLKAHGIPVVKHLPAVGKNMSDHISAGHVSFFCDPALTMEYLNVPYKSILPLLQWLVTGTGPLASNAVESVVFVETRDKKKPFASQAARGQEIANTSSGPGAPDVEICFVPIGMTSKGLSAVSLVPLLLRPLSVGSVSLASDSPFAKPNIDANYLSHPNDLKTLLYGMRLALYLGKTTTIQDLNTEHLKYADYPHMWPGGLGPDEVTDEELTEYLKKSADTIFHPVSTARMGPKEEGNVVDPMLRVYGVDGLRVVDASVFPTQISGHPTAPIIAIAEKAADMIRKGQ